MITFEDYEKQRKNNVPECLGHTKPLGTGLSGQEMDNCFTFLPGPTKQLDLHILFATMLVRAIQMSGQIKRGKSSDTVYSPYSFNSSDT